MAPATAGFSTLAWCPTLFWIGFVFWFHDLPRGGNLSAAIVAGALYSAAIAATSVPLLFLSGFAFPTEESPPSPLRWLANALAIQAMPKLNQMGATWRETAPDIGWLAQLTVAHIGLAWSLAARRVRAAAYRP